MARRKFDRGGQPKRRFMVFAFAKSGKTWTVANMIKIEHERNPNAKFYLMDSEDAWEQSTLEMPEVVDIPEVYNVFDRKEFGEDFATIRKDIMERYRKTGKVQDWLFVDSVSELWELIQMEFIGEIWGQEVGEKFFEMRKAQEKKVLDGEAEETRLHGWEDWGVMKRRHNIDIVDQMKRLPCNLVWTAKAKQLVEEPKRGSDPEREVIRDTFGEIGWKPEGEWGNAFRVDSVLFLWKQVVEKEVRYYMTSTVGERGTEDMGKTRIPKDSNAYRVWLDNQPIREPPSTRAEPSFDEMLRGKV